MPAELVFGIAVAVGGAIAFAAGYQRRRQARAFREIPRLTRASRVGTQVLAIGIVRPTAPEIDALLSGRPCVAYCARAYRGDFDAPRQLWERGSIVPFGLEREDGTTIAVDSTHVLFRFPPLPLPADAPDRCLEFAVACGISERVRKQLQYEEIIVLEGMRVAVAGRLAESGKLAGDGSQPIIIGVPF